VLAGFAAARLYRSGRAGRVAVAVAVALMIAEYRSSPPLDTVPARVPTVYRWLATQPRTITLGLPIARPERLDITPDPLHMYFSVFHWQPLVNGYSGFFPPSYFELIHVMRSFPDDASLEYLRKRGVELLVLDRRAYPEPQYTALAESLLVSPALTFVGEFPDRERPTLVFRMRGSREEIARHGPVR
jgi:hypothetical protein